MSDTLNTCPHCTEEFTPELESAGGYGRDEQGQDRTDVELARCSRCGKRVRRSPPDESWQPWNE